MSLFKELLEAKIAQKEPKYKDEDDVTAMLIKLGSAADIWMNAHQLKSLMDLLNAGAVVKYVSIDADVFDDDDIHNDKSVFEVAAKKASIKANSGWELFAYEWDGSDEAADVILIKKK